MWADACGLLCGSLSAQIQSFKNTKTGRINEKKDCKQMCKSSFFFGFNFSGKRKKKKTTIKMKNTSRAVRARQKQKEKNTHTHTPQAVVELRSYPASTVLLCVFATLVVVVTQPGTAAGQCGGGGLKCNSPPAGFRNRKITGLCLHVGQVFSQSSR